MGISYFGTVAFVFECVVDVHVLVAVSEFGVGLEVCIAHDINSCGHVVCSKAMPLDCLQKQMLCCARLMVTLVLHQ